MRTMYCLAVLALLLQPAHAAGSPQDFDLACTMTAGAEMG